jgi:hypothetical protein
VYSIVGWGDGSSKAALIGETFGFDGMPATSQAKDAPTTRIKRAEAITNLKTEGRIENLLVKWHRLTFELIGRGDYIQPSIQ